MACLPKGLPGTTSAATVAIQMKSAFPSIRFGLMVGIGGGVPSASFDIRLGDVVVSQPHMGHGGVVQYDFGKTRPNEFERTGFLNSPPTVLLNTISVVHANHLTGESRLAEFLSCLSNLPVFTPPHSEPDDLFMASYHHSYGETCDECSKRMLVIRPSRTEDIVVHFGTIASGNQVMRDGVVRDKLSSQLGGVLCFEMEAAGLMHEFPCLNIRGISDYADSHKNKKWQGYAAATAAACAKDVLSVIPAREIRTAPTVDEAISNREPIPPRLNKIHSETFAHDQFDSFSFPRLVTPSVPASRRCFFCGLCFLNKYVFTRHIKDKHYPQFEYICPEAGCGVKQGRKDKIRAHIRVHPGINPESFVTTERPCPTECAYCRLSINNWDEFYTCILSHYGKSQLEP
jgi:nucleoside phosphorylase